MSSNYINKYRFINLALIAFLAFGATINLFSIGPILPLLIDHYVISNTMAGLLVSITWLAHIVLSVPMSTMIGRWNLKLIVSIGAILSSVPIFTFLTVDNFALLLLVRFIGSAGMIFLIVCSGPFFMLIFPRNELPVANGLLVASGSLGVSFSVFIVARLSEMIGWEFVLTGFGGLAALGVIAWVLFARVPNSKSGVATHIDISETWAVVRDSKTILITLADAGPLALMTVLMAWLPTFYNEVHGFSLTTIGSLMGVHGFAGFIGMLIASYATTRIHRRRPFLILPGILITTAGCAVVILVDLPMTYLFLALCGIGLWAYLPALLTIPIELNPHSPARVAVIAGTLFTGTGITGLLGPLVVGAIVDRTGSFLPGFAIFLIFSLTLILAGILLPETGKATVKTGT